MFRKILRVFTDFGKNIVKVVFALELILNELASGFFFFDYQTEKKNFSESTHVRGFQKVTENTSNKGDFHSQVVPDFI